MESEIVELRHALSEREKELDALYRLAAIFARPADDIQAVLQETARVLCASMQYPSSVRVEIDADGRCAGNCLDGEVFDSYRVDHVFSIDRRVIVAVGYRCREFLIEEREKHLVDATASLLMDALERTLMEQVLRESTRTLQRQAEDLERKNIALREVLYQIEEEKHEIFKEARATVDVSIQPYLHRLKRDAASTEETTRCVTQIEAAFSRLFAAHEDAYTRVADRLTPREIEICGLIKNGLTSKEIALFLHISECTVERHRNTIRSKLELTNQKTNLTTYLRGSI